MMQRLSCAAMVVAVVAISAPLRAETPMSPVHRTAPASPSRQWVEPPPAPAQARPLRSTAATPDARSERPAREIRTARQGRHRARGRSRDNMTSYLNRQQLRGGWYGSGMSYYHYRGHGPAPYSNSGE
jgi:hypothetical protein